jgi:hypothetical protein
MQIFYSMMFWLSYFLAWALLFIINMSLFEKWTSFSVKLEVFETQNKALWNIIRWQFIWQSIMIWTLIYFLWNSYSWKFDIEAFTTSMMEIFAFWLFGIFIFQSILYLLAKFTPMEKEILIDNNESLWMIIEWLIIATSIILSLSLYSY